MTGDQFFALMGFTGLFILAKAFLEMIDQQITLQMLFAKIERPVTRVYFVLNTISVFCLWGMFMADRKSCVACVAHCYFTYACIGRAVAYKYQQSLLTCRSIPLKYNAILLFMTILITLLVALVGHDKQGNSNTFLFDYMQHFNIFTISFKLFQLFIRCAQKLRQVAVPREGLESPREGLESPREGLKSPREGLKSPREGLKIPRAGLNSPREGLKSRRGGGAKAFTRSTVES